MDFSNYTFLKLKREGRVLTASFNRPETLNAFDVDGIMERDVIRLFREVAADDETHVLVLTGEGRAFSAGGDLKGMQLLIDKPELFLPAVRVGKEVIFAMLDCTKPIVAKVNGHAMGLGATLALFSDVIFASAKAKIGDPHVSAGLVAGDGGAVIWPQLVGYARAKEYLLTGDHLTAERAERIGLINYCVAPEELDGVVDKFAQRLANGASKSVQWTKASINVGLKQLAHSMMDASMAYEALSNSTEDHQEAVSAFMEKRAPVFMGR